MEEKKGKFISRSALLKRTGWTGAAVTKLLGEPDKVTEPKTEGGKARRRYLLKRVERIETKGRLNTFNDKRVKRQAKKAASPA